jgi:chromosome segregation ATPase
MGKGSSDDKGPKGAMMIEDIMNMDLGVPGRSEASRAGAHGSQLKDVVGGVAQMLRDLEAQLAKVMEVNATLEKELLEARAGVRKVERERDELAERLGRMEAEGGTLDDVRGELLALQRERRQLAERLEAAEEQARQAEDRLRQADLRIERMAAERDDALEEVQCLEIQFSRASTAVLELRQKYEDLIVQRDQLTARIRGLEGEVGAAAEERDELRLELEESRNAMEEIRRSLVEVGAQSQRLRGGEQRE